MSVLSQKTFFYILGFAATLMVMGAGCTLQIGATSDGGVFKSVNNGATWDQKSQIVTIDGKKESFGNVDVVKVVVDQYNPNSLFLATRRYGLLASNDGGETWNRVYDKDSTVVDMAADPRSRCVFYLATPSQVLKTSDCARQWQVVFDETRTKTQITSLALDAHEPSILYITNTSGELLKSTNYGGSWYVVYSLPGAAFMKLVIDRGSSDVLYLATDDQGILRTQNQGLQWDEISLPLQGFEGALQYRFLSTLSRTDSLWYVSSGGIFRTFNGGSNWEKISVLTPLKRVEILATTTNPSNDDEMYYATSGTLYHTVDGGKSWNTRPLPTTRAAAYLAVDPFSPNNIYLGIKIHKQQAIFLY